MYLSDAHMKHKYVIAEGKLHKHECKHCRKVFYCDWDKKNCDRPLCYPCNAKRVKMKAEGKERDFWFSSEPDARKFYRRQFWATQGRWSTRG